MASQIRPLFRAHVLLLPVYSEERDAVDTALCYARCISSCHGVSGVSKFISDLAKGVVACNIVSLFADPFGSHVDQKILALSRVDMPLIPPQSSPAGDPFFLGTHIVHTEQPQALETRH